MVSHVGENSFAGGIEGLRVLISSDILKILSAFFFFFVAHPSTALGHGDFRGCVQGE